MALKRDRQLLHAALVGIEVRLAEIERQLEELRVKTRARAPLPRRAARKRGAAGTTPTQS